jgi:hypothetical protein
VSSSKLLFLQDFLSKFSKNVLGFARVDLQMFVSKFCSFPAISLLARVVVVQDMWWWLRRICGGGGAGYVVVVAQNMWWWWRRICGGGNRK